MKILFATDGSAHALSALATLIDNLAWFRGPPEVLLINLHPPLPYRSVAGWAGKESIARHYDDEGEAALAESRKLLEARDVKFTAVKAVGDAAQGIVEHAGSAGCDLIAMATQGHGALVNLALGSVSTKVLALSPVPVLLLK